MEPGVTVLHEALVANGHRAPLLVVTARYVSTPVRKRLASLPLVHIFRVPAGYKEYCKTTKRTNVHDCAHLKLLLFDLKNIQKVIFLEHDTLVSGSLKDLIELPPFSAVRQPHVGLFETSVMVIAPDPQVYSVLYNEYCKVIRRGDGTTDHHILRAVVPDEAWTEASDTFNVPQEHMDVLWYRCVDKTPAIIHFKGKLKPWNWWRKSIGESMSLNAFRKWCNAAKPTRYACRVPDAREEMIPPMQPHGWSDQHQFTVLLSTFRRQTWQKMVWHYASLSFVKKVILIWHDPFRDAPSKESLPAKTIVWQSKKDSLNNRFYGPGNISDCVYIADDDMMVEGSQLRRGFNVWKGHTKRLVGFFPRKWMTESPYYSAHVYDGYNVVLTKGLFTHRSFLYMYSYLLPIRIKEVVEEYSNCEDILFNMMVTGYNGLAPLHVLVQGTIQDMGHGTGISSSPSHFATRYKCARALIQEMGLKHAPLTLGSYSDRPLKNKERV